jgi:hypothetical protein
MSTKTAHSPVMHVNANLPTADIHIDSKGDLVIRNQEFARLVQQFLTSEEGKQIHQQEVHLLCCELQCPLC